MAERSVTREYPDKSLDKLGQIIAKGFDENTEQHRQIFEKFEKIDERFENVNARLNIIKVIYSEIKGKMVFREEHEDLMSRVDLIEEKLGVVS